MYATHLSVSGFKGISTPRSYALSPVTCILGDNGTGKSSILDAFKSVLTGTVPESALNVDSTEGTAEIIFDNGTSLAVSLSEKGSSHLSCGKKITKKSAGEVREKIMNTPVDIVDVLLDSKQGAFDVKPEEFSRLVSGIIRARMDASKLYDRMNLSQQETDLLKDLYKDPEIDFTGIESLFRSIGDKLTQANRDVSAIRAQISLLCSTPPSRPLQLLDSARKAALQEYASAKEAEARQKAYEQASERRKTYLEDLRKLKAEVDSRRVPAPVQGELENRQSMLEGLLNKISTEKGDIAAFEKNAASFVQILKELESNVCPISRSLVCTTDKTAIRGELEAQAAENRVKADQHRQILAALETQLSSLKTAIAALREKENAYRAFVRLEEQYKAKAAGCPEVPQQPAACSLSLADCEKKLNDINKEYADAESYEKGLQLKASAQSRLDEAVLLTGLKPKFAPKGEAYNLILTAMSGQLTDMVNNTAAEMKLDYTYQFRFDGGLQLYGKQNAMTEFINVRNMSDGEKFIAQLLLLSVINEASGFGFIVIDNFDALDAVHLQKVLDLITDPVFLGKYNNVLLAGVCHSDTQDLLATYPSINIIQP